MGGEGEGGGGQWLHGDIFNTRLPKKPTGHV
jgi:hypothetical protein